MRTPSSSLRLLLWSALAACLAACEPGPSINPERPPPPGEGSESLGQQTFALTDTMAQYTQKCDAAIGVTVPDFICDSGTEPPTTNAHADGTCDRPNRLNRECDPGSRFQVLTNTANAFVVAHCRKKHQGNGLFGDIAVIQYNKKTGATCFYQALANNLDGNVKAPSSGKYNWLTPTQTAAINCVSCHDNGPLVRSPYLTQISDNNKLPGAGDVSFNRDQPYYFIGNDFASWRAYKVEVSGNLCNGCHRMGTNNILGVPNGGALDLGLRATAPSETSKNPHSSASPIWMLPGQITYSADNAAAAQAIASCAQHRGDNPLPNTSACRITQYTAMSAPTVPGHFTAVWEPGTQPEIQVYGWSYADYREKYDQLWGQGWRLFSLQPYVVNNQVLYNAVWRQSTEGELQVYGWSYADFRSKYDSLWSQGWRLKILQPYVVSGQVYYTAVWRPSTEGELQVYGWSYADYRTQYDSLWNQGWRLKLIQPYVLNGQVYYTAVWRPSTEGELQVYGWSYADYKARYDSIVNQGWRLKLLEPYVLNGQVYYTAVWRPATTNELQQYDVSYTDYRSNYDDLWDQGWRLKILRSY